MKLTKGLKVILLTTLLLLYLSGAITWGLSHWFLVQGALGLETSPFRYWWLQIHAIIGLWFFIVFGYLFHAHLEPSWRRRKKRRSGGLLAGVCIFLLATVPGLYYIANETMKNRVAWIHTYVGLLAVFAVAMHLRAKAK